MDFLFLDIWLIQYLIIFLSFCFSTFGLYLIAEKELYEMKLNTDRVI